MRRLADRFGAFSVAGVVTVVNCVLVGVASGQDLTHKAAPQQKAVLLVGGTVHTVSGETIERGSVLFDKGRIVSVGRERPSTGGAEVVDVSGLHVFPGLISADTQLGLVEFPPVRVTVDSGEVNDVAPEVRPSVAVNPDSTLLPVTRTNGVLTVAVLPSGGSIAGQVSVIRLDGWTTADMTVKGEAGVLVNWPNVRPITAWWMDRSADDQLKEIRERVVTIDETFKSARAYAAARKADPSTAVDLRWEAMRGLFAAVGKVGGGAGGAGGAGGGGALPVFITANERDQITSAVSWAAEAGLRAVIVGGRDAVECAELLRRHDVPVVVEGTFGFPRRDDAPYDEAYSLPARLMAAGVRFCIAGGDRTANERNLPYGAGMAVAHGLDIESAHKAITLWPAQVLGVSDSLGSIEAGKSATLIVTDGDVLEVTTNVRMAFVDGRRIDLRNKQSELAEKYREKYRQRGGSGGGSGGVGAASAGSGAGR